MEKSTGDDGEAPSTPDTISVDDGIYLSPAGRARMEGDFARLIPDNHDAKRAFSDLITNIKTNPKVERSWRRLMHFNEHQERLVAEMEISDTETCDAEDQPLIWTGYYRFNLTSELLPQQFGRYGWILGGGRDELRNDGVDIMLTSTKERHRVRGRHARLALNESSNALMLIVEPKKIVRLNGEPIHDASRVIKAPRTHLQLGILQYRFEYTGLSLARYHDQLERLRNSNILKGTVHKALEATPTEKQISLKDYIIHPPFAYGSYGVISGCVRATDGMPCAAKRVARTDRSQSEIDAEIAMFRAVGGHVSVKVCGESAVPG